MQIASNTRRSRFNELALGLVSGSGLVFSVKIVYSFTGNAIDVISGVASGAQGCGPHRVALARGGKRANICI